MLITALHIAKTASYETPANTLVGYVEFSDEELGTSKVRLSPATLVKMLAIIQDDVVVKLTQVAKLSPSAIRNTVAEVELANNPLLANIKE